LSRRAFRLETAEGNLYTQAALVKLFERDDRASPCASRSIGKWTFAIGYWIIPIDLGAVSEIRFHWIFFNPSGNSMIKTQISLTNENVSRIQQKQKTSLTKIDSRVPSRTIVAMAMAPFQHWRKRQQTTDQFRILFLSSERRNTIKLLHRKIKNLFGCGFRFL